MVEFGWFGVVWVENLLGGFWLLEFVKIWDICEIVEILNLNGGMFGVFCGGKVWLNWKLCGCCGVVLWGNLGVGIIRLLRCVCWMMGCLAVEFWGNEF